MKNEISIQVRLLRSLKNTLESNFLFYLARIFGNKSIIRVGKEDEVEICSFLGKEYWLREIL